MTRIDAEALDRAIAKSPHYWTRYNRQRAAAIIELYIAETVLSALPAAGGVGTYAATPEQIAAAKRIWGNRYGVGLDGFIAQLWKVMSALAPSAIQGHESREPEGSLEVERGDFSFIKQRNPDAVIERPNWPLLLHGHTKDFVSGMTDLVVVTRQSAKLGGQYVRKAMEQDAYHTSMAAQEELEAASHSCAVTLSDVLASFPRAEAALRANCGVGSYDPASRPNRPRKLEVAAFEDGRICVGYSNTDENGGFSILGDITDQIRALSAQSSPESVANGASIKLDGAGTPEGWVLVPKEPTFGCHPGSMSMAGAENLPSCDEISGHAGTIACNVYRAMLAAAPAPQPIEGTANALFTRASAALESLVGADLCYAGSEIHIRTDSHADAIARVRVARDVLTAISPPSRESSEEGSR